MCAVPLTRRPDDVPPAAFAFRYQVGPPVVDLQGVMANHEIVGLLVDVAARHSDALGWDLAAYRRLGAWWVVRRHEVDFLAPARLDDELVCYTWPSAFTKATGDRRHVLVRAVDGSVVARALNVWALVDIQTGRPRRIPPEIQAAFDPRRFDRLQSP